MNHRVKEGTGGAIRMKNLEISFGSGPTAIRAVENINIDIAPGEFISVLGPSGCGKSTFINAIAGFLRPHSGDLLLDREEIKRPGADRGVVFQQHTLFPWKTVLRNVEFGLKMGGVPRAERQRQANEILAEVGLGDFLHHYPSQLSGGMQQRVSLARVLVNRPRVLLMDEPFSALDAQTRLQMQEMLLELWTHHRMTVVFVTHDIDEAIFLSDRVVVLTRRPGRIQAEFPIELDRPRTAEALACEAFMRLKRRCMELLRQAPESAHTIKPPSQVLRARSPVPA
ncbi:MAG TPA: ABC transporter ATP-binding protein [Chthoniobacterales bacterium]